MFLYLWPRDRIKRRNLLWGGKKSIDWLWVNLSGSRRERRPLVSSDRLTETTCCLASSIQDIHLLPLGTPPVTRDLDGRQKRSERKMNPFTVALQQSKATCCLAVLFFFCFVRGQLKFWSLQMGEKEEKVCFVCCEKRSVGQRDKISCEFGMAAKRAMNLRLLPLSCTKVASGLTKVRWYENWANFSATKSRC